MCFHEHIVSLTEGFESYVYVGTTLSDEKHVLSELFRSDEWSSILKPGKSVDDKNDTTSIVADDKEVITKERAISMTRRSISKSYRASIEKELKEFYNADEIDLDMVCKSVVNTLRLYAVVDVSVGWFGYFSIYHPDTGRYYENTFLKRVLGLNRYNRWCDIYTNAIEK